MTTSTGTRQPRGVAFTIKFGARFQNLRSIHGALWLEGRHILQHPQVLVNRGGRRPPPNSALISKIGAHFMELSGLKAPYFTTSAGTCQQGGAALTTKVGAHFQNRRLLHVALWLDGAIVYNIHTYLSTGGGGAHHQTRRSLPTSALNSWSFLA